jgi:O-antigen ligase
MLLLLVVLPLLLAPLILPLKGRSAAGAVVLLFILYTRLSDLGIDTHGVSPVDPKGLSSISQICLLALTALVFVRRTREGGARSLGSQSGTWMAIGLYLSVLYASSVWAPDEGLAAGQAASLLKNLLIVYVIAELLNTTRAQRLAVWSLLAAGDLMSGLTILQDATHTFDNTYLGMAQAPIRQIVGMDSGFRSSGPIGDPNFYSLILAVLVPLALLRLRDERHPTLRLAALVTTVLLLGAIALTYSRGGLVTVIIPIVLLVPLAHIKPRHVVVTLLLALPFLPLVPGAYWQRIATLAQGDNSITSRAGSQDVALAMFTAHPLGGVGADNYTVTYRLISMQLNVPDAAENPHNLYLAIAAETGLAGFLTFTGAMMMVLRGLWRRRAEAMLRDDRVVEGLATSCLLALATYLIGVVFLPIAYPRYLWVLVGLALAITIPAEAPERGRAWVPSSIAAGVT